MRQPWGLPEIVKELGQLFLDQIALLDERFHGGEQRPRAGKLTSRQHEPGGER
jgi:hypothetical protein